MGKSDQKKDAIDSIYYRDGVDTSIAMRVLRRARQAMFDLFMQKMRPGPETRIVDIGVSDEENDGANFLEKYFPWKQNITCAGLGDGVALRRAHPDVAFKKIEAGKPLPFADGAFDIACSNAVLEHVGGITERRNFIAEHLRIARSVFITVPNRWFPIEHHTGLPLLHYAPKLFRRSLAKTRYDYWSDPNHMDFLDRPLLRREWPGADAPLIVTTGLPLGPFSSNIAIIRPLSTLTGGGMASTTTVLG